MSIFTGGGRRARGRDVPVPSELELVELAARRLDDAKQYRDQTIKHARTSHVRAIAHAAGISESRVKQIRQATTALGHQATRPPITDVDLHIDDSTLNDGDRVFSLLEVAPWIPTYASERAYLATLDTRSPGPDFGWNYYDSDPTQRFVVSTRHLAGRAGLEIYAFQGDNSDGSGNHDHTGFIGSTAGPCYVLGQLPSRRVAEAAIYANISQLSHRPGALAWIYGRITATNRILRAAMDPIDQLATPSSRFIDYLDHTTNKD